MSNEITVSINCSLQEMYDILENKGFSIIDKYNMRDTYYIQKGIDIKRQNIKKILNQYVLIRNIIQFVPDNFIDSYNIVKFTYKNKRIASDGTIISQDKKECQIKNINQGKEFIKAIGYKELMTIREKAVVYGKNELKLVVKDVENIDNLLEIETIEENPKFNTTDKLKEKINELQIPINTNNYFVKKAEIELKKILGDL